MTSSPVLTISYALNPPSQATPLPAHLSATKKHEFTLDVTGQGDHYTALRNAIAEARVVTGQELTEWRDVVAAAEKDKVGGKVRPDADEEEDGGEEEE